MEREINLVDQFLRKCLIPFSRVLYFTVLGLAGCFLKDIQEYIKQLFSSGSVDLNSKQQEDKQDLYL